MKKLLILLTSIICLLSSCGENSHSKTFNIVMLNNDTITVCAEHFEYTKANTVLFSNFSGDTYEVASFPKDSVKYIYSISNN